MEPSKGGVFGVVRNQETGDAISGVTVFALGLDWYHRDFRITGKATSDAQGRFQLIATDAPSYFDESLVALGNGTCSAFEWPQFDGHVDDPILDPITLTRGRWIERDVFVRPAVTITGRVQLPDGKPAVGASVALHRDRLRRCLFPWEQFPPVTCDEDGTYTIDYVGDAETTGILAQLDGYQPFLEHPPANALAGSTKTIDFRFEAPRRLTVRVPDADTKQPLDGARIEVNSIAYSEDDEYLDCISAQTDQNGLATISGFDYFYCGIDVTRDGYGSYSRNIEDRDDPFWQDAGTGDPLHKRATVELHPHTTIMGRVEWPLHVTNPPGVRVTATGQTSHQREDWDETVKTNPSGAFTIAAPPSGGVQLTGTAT